MNKCILHHNQTDMNSSVILEYHCVEILERFHPDLTLLQHTATTKFCLLFLLQLKADVNVCTYGGNSPLHFAASQGSPPLCSMLIAAGN